MPAPRAVLTDILDLGLDPKKSHNLLSKDGKLRNKDLLQKKEDNEKLKTGLVFLSSEKEEITKNLIEEKENTTLELKNSKVVDLELKKDSSVLLEEEKKETINLVEDKKPSVELSERQKKKQQYFQKKSASNNS